MEGLWSRTLKIMLLGKDDKKLLGPLEDSLERCYMMERVDHTGNMTEVN